MEFYEHNVSGGRSILFLHGANTGAWMWRPVIERLRDFHCIAVDMPGHGRSGNQDWKSFDETAAGIAGLIRRKGKNGVASVVGLSLGGYVALHLMKAAPEVIERVFISGVPAHRIPNAWLIRLAGYLFVPFLHSRRLLRMNARNLRIEPDSMAEYITNAKRNSRKSFMKINRQALEFTPPTEAQEANLPVLFVAGEREHRIILESLPHFAEHFRQAGCRVAQNVGHGWSNEAPELFADAVRSWVNGEDLPQDLLPAPGR